MQVRAMILKSNEGEEIHQFLGLLRAGLNPKNQLPGSLTQNRIWSTILASMSLSRYSILLAARHLTANHRLMIKSIKVPHLKTLMRIKARLKKTHLIIHKNSRNLKKKSQLRYLALTKIHLRILIESKKTLLKNKKPLIKIKHFNGQQKRAKRVTMTKKKAQMLLHNK